MTEITSTSTLTPALRMTEARAEIVPVRSDLGPLVDAWLAELSENTRRAYRTDLYAFAAYCQAQGIRPVDAERRHLAAWRESMLQEGKAERTVARRLACLKSFFRYCVEEGVLAASPAANLRVSAVKSDSPTQRPDRDELKAMLEACRSPRERALLALMAGSGMRRSEAASIRFDDLETREGFPVALITRKGGKRSVIRLHPRAVEAIEELRAEGTGIGYIFPGTDRKTRKTVSSRPIHGAALDAMVKRVTLRAGVAKSLAPHSLRRAFATELFEKKVPLDRIQDAMGHADPRTTRVYDLERESVRRSPVGELEDLFD